MNTIFTRRSVRKYLDKKIETENIERKLRAAMQAPSATNQQPWEFIVVDERETIDKLAEFSPYAKMLPGAPLAFVVLEKQGMKAPLFTEQDLGAAVQNLMLQAVEDGLGTVWMGVGRGTERETFLTEMFTLPETVKPFAVLAVGYPQDENANKFTDRYDAERVHWNKY